jgi:oxygen-independent coproporphyrinogen-3 oxidase
LFAFGITSISQLKNVYAQNFKTENEYFKAIDDERLPVFKGYHLTEDEIMNLMCNFELNFNEIENEFQINFKEYFKNSLSQLSEMLDEGLIEMNDEGLKVTEMGRLLIRNIAMKFDGFIERQQDKMKYSRTI